MPKKEKKPREPFNLRKELTLSPGYILAFAWAIFTVVLVVWVVFASLSTSKEIFGNNMFKFETGFHFENYVKAWKSQKVSVYFTNSLIYAAISCTAIVLITCPASYVLSRFRFKGNAFIQTMISTALGIPAIMIIMPLFSISTQLRLNNTRPTIIFLYIAMNIPFTIFFMLAFFKNLSVSFEEAAAIDGCSPSSTFWRIMFPLAQPGIITVTIFNFITVWNEYFMSLVFASKARVRPVAVGLYNMMQGMRYTGDWGGMFASVVIVFAPTFILYLFLSEKIIAGVTAGAIKG